MIAQDSLIQVVIILNKVPVSKPWFSEAGALLLSLLEKVRS